MSRPSALHGGSEVLGLRGQIGPISLVTFGQEVSRSERHQFVALMSVFVVNTNAVAFVQLFDFWDNPVLWSNLLPKLLIFCQKSGFWDSTGPLWHKTAGSWRWQSCAPFLFAFPYGKRLLFQSNQCQYRVLKDIHPTYEQSVDNGEIMSYLGQYKSHGHQTFDQQ